MKRGEHHSSSKEANVGETGEPKAKRIPKTAEEEEEEEAYELFVAYQEGHDEEEEDDPNAEEELGSSDSDTDSDEEHRAVTTVVSWREGAAVGRLGAAQRAAVEAMSRQIYDGTDEGFREIADAIARAGPSNKVSESKEDEKEEETAPVRVVGMLVLRAKPAPVEITQAFVAPTLRDAGLGKRLVRRALEHASTVLRAARVVCYAVGGSGGFYARLGFAPVDARDAADARTGTPAADRAEMARALVPGTHYDVDSDDDGDDYDEGADDDYDEDFGDDDGDAFDDDED